MCDHFGFNPKMCLISPHIFTAYCHRSIRKLKRIYKLVLFIYKTSNLNPVWWQRKLASINMVDCIIWMLCAFIWIPFILIFMHSIVGKECFLLSWVDLTTESSLLVTPQPDGAKTGHGKTRRGMGGSDTTTQHPSAVVPGRLAYLPSCWFINKAITLTERTLPLKASLLVR